MTSAGVGIFGGGYPIPALRKGYSPNPMAQAERIRKKAQAVLDGGFGMVPGSPGIPQVKWLEPHNIYTVVPAVEADGETPKFIPVCQCGRNVNVHQPTCAITRLELQTERYDFPLGTPDPHDSSQILNLREYPEQIWVLCKWLPPPDPAMWMLMDPDMATYPANGAYEAVSVNGHLVWAPGPFPTPALSEWVVKQFKYFWDNRKLIQQKLDERMAAKDWTPPKDDRGIYDTTEKGPASSRYHQYRDQLRDAMTLNGHIPGTKGSVGYPSAGPSSVGPSIVLAKD